MKEEHWRNTSYVRWRTAHQSLLQPIRRGLWKPGPERISKAIVLVSKGVFLKLSQKAESVLQTGTKGNKCEVICNCSLQAWVTASDTHTCWSEIRSQPVRSHWPYLLKIPTLYDGRGHTFPRAVLLTETTRSLFWKLLQDTKKCDFLFLIKMNISFF